VSDNISIGFHVLPLLKTLPEKLISPDTSNVYPGVDCFIPSLSFVVSQWRFVSDCIVPVPLPINSLFYVKVVAPVPPYDTDSVPV
jgi:hypothetical protein